MHWSNPNYEELSRLCSSLCLADREVDILLKSISNLKWNKGFPKSARQLRVEEKKAMESTSDIIIFDSPIPVPLDEEGNPIFTSGPCQVIMYDIMKVMENIINHNDHAEFIHWQFEPDLNTNGKRIYSELWSSEWWNNEQASLPCGREGKILAICLASDETLVTLGDRKVHPVYVFCGNVHRWYKNHGTSWSLLGFLPVIKCPKTVSSRPLVREYKRLVYRWAIGQITQHILTHKDGLVINVRDCTGNVMPTFVYPRMALYAADELGQRTNVYGGYSGRCNMPCRTCNVTPRCGEASLEGLKAQGELRQLSDITVYFDEKNELSVMPSDVSMKLSIHKEYNPLYFVPGFNPLMNPPCRMHQTEGGIFKTMLQDIVALLKMTGGTACQTSFDMLWSCIIPFPGIKMFRNGVCDVANVTASEHRSMSNCLPFVLRGVDEAFHISSKLDRPPGFLEFLACLYLGWRWLLGLETHDDSTLDLLDAFGHALQEQFEQLKREVKGEPDFVVTEGPKYHSILHWSHWIRTYGATGNYNTEIFELAHRLTIKIWEQKLSMRSNHAEMKVMRQYSLFSGLSHETPTEGEDKRSVHRNWGKGGFRGYIVLISELGLDVSQVKSLHDFEQSLEFTSLSIEHLKETYDDLIGTAGKRSYDVSVLIAVLESSKDFMNHLRQQGPHSGDDCGIKLFSPDNHLCLKLWRKSYFAPRDCYLREGSFVMYSANLGSRQNGVKVGCVRWMFSIGQLQYVIVQRLKRDKTMSAASNNETLLEALKSFLMLDTEDCDKMKKLFRAFRMCDGSVFRAHECYEILVVDDGNVMDTESYPIRDHVCMQLDMKYGRQRSMSNRPFDFPNLRLFLTEMLIAQ